MRKNVFEKITSWYLRLITGKDNFSKKKLRIWTVILLPSLVITLSVAIAVFFEGLKNTKEIEYLENLILSKQQLISDCFKDLSSVSRKINPSGQQFSSDVLKNTIHLSELEITQARETMLSHKNERVIRFLILPFIILLFFIIPFIIFRLKKWINEK